MNLSEVSIKKPVFAWMLMLALILFGGICFTRMGVSQLPDVDFPVVNISVRLDGAAPEVMEADVVEPIEDAVMSVKGILNVTSSAKSGSANINLEFVLSKDIDVAVQEVQTVIAQVQRQLPRDMDPPVVSKNNPEDQPILWFTIMTKTHNEKELMQFVRDQIKDKFNTVEGVSEVTLGGYVDPALRVWVSAKKLNGYQLTVGDVIGAIQSEHSELPSGRVEMPEKELNVRTMGEVLTTDEFGLLAINRRGGAPNFTPIPLRDVAEIEDGLADIRRKSRSMGQLAVGIGIKKQRGSNAVAVAKAAKKRLNEVIPTLPKGYEMAVNFDSTKFIEESVSELNFTLVLSAVLTAIVCWLFLGSWSATLNIIMAIPTSVVGAFIALYALGFTLNVFTLLGLSLAIGIVVDDAIMVLENIVRHYEMKKSRVQAALDGSKEITFAALAATLSVVAIFLPIAFMSGIIGKYLYQFGVTLSVSVMLSLLEALTLAPMRCSQFLDVGERQTRLGQAVESWFQWTSRVYGSVLPTVLRFRWAVIVGSIVFFVASLLIVKLVKKEFVPSQDQSRLFVRVQTPVGSSLDFTDTKVKEVEDIVQKYAETDRYYGAIGGFGGGEVNTAVLFVTMKNPGERPIDVNLGRRLTQNDFAEKLRKDVKKLSQVKAFVQDLSLSGFSSHRGFPVQFTVTGSDWEKLVDLSEQFKDEMEKSGQMTDVDSNYRTGQPEIRILPNREKARARGVSVSEISQTISSLIGGALAGRYSKGNRRYDVRVRLKPDERSKPEQILLLNVRNNRGELIPLRDVVTLTERPSLQAIHHQDRERAITLTANVSKTSSQAEAMETVQKIGKTLMPDGYKVLLTGSSQTFSESFSGLRFAIILGIVVAYMILGSQFNSFVHPLTVLIALPFSVSGAFMSLYLGNQSLNIFSFIGIVLLMGLTKKNSILLVDFTNQLRSEGNDVTTALKKAGPIRLRPILMTTISTIAGAVPPALAIGPGAELRVPMALTVLGGMIVSTLLTLLVVPAVYSVLPGRFQTTAVDLS